MSYADERRARAGALADLLRAEVAATERGTTDASEAWEMAAIVRECCQRFRPELVGDLAAAPDSGSFTVTSGMTGDRFRVTVTAEGARRAVQA